MERRRRYAVSAAPPSATVHHRQVGSYSPPPPSSDFIPTILRILAIQPCICLAMPLTINDRNIQIPDDCPQWRSSFCATCIIIRPATCHCPRDGWALRLRNPPHMVEMVATGFRAGKMEAVMVATSSSNCRDEVRVDTYLTCACTYCRQGG